MNAHGARPAGHVTAALPEGRRLCEQQQRKSPRLQSRGERSGQVRQCARRMRAAGRGPAEIEPNRHPHRHPPRGARLLTHISHSRVTCIHAWVSPYLKAEFPSHLARGPPSKSPCKPPPNLRTHGSGDFAGPSASPAHGSPASTSPSASTPVRGPAILSWVEAPRGGTTCPRARPRGSLQVGL